MGKGRSENYGVNLGNMQMKLREINELGLELIKSFEGFSAQQYICSGGFNTIGYGHKITKTDILPQIISRSEAEELLKKDLLVAQNSVIRNVNVMLNDNQFSALVSFTFNLGGGAFQRSTLRQKLNYHLYEEAAEELLKWVYSSGNKSAGLVRRRMAERNLFLS